MQSHALDRFISAQHGVYTQALSEIESGRKQSHWMWFIFPQLKGLGRSQMAQYYGLDGLAEATAYLQHPVLGPNLIRITKAVLQLKPKSAHAVFGSPDDMKLRSCMTLFAEVPQADPVFSMVLRDYFDDKPDPATLARIRTVS